MRVLVLKTSFVLVGWINILAELTESGKIVSDVEADADIKHFLSSTLKECVGDDHIFVLSVIFDSYFDAMFLRLSILLMKTEEEGEPSEDKKDQVIEKIENILRDQLHCSLPFDEQTMEHIRALVGAYLSLLLENYEQR